MAGPRLLVVASRGAGAVPVLSALSDGSRSEIPTVDPHRARGMLPHYDVAVLVHDVAHDWISKLIQHRNHVELGVRLVVVNVPHRRSIVLRYLLAGIDGYTFVDDQPAHLEEVIAAAQRGDLLLDPRTAALVVDDLNEVREQLDHAGLYAFSGEPREVLTEREHEILQLIATEDLSNRAIAERLFIEVGTVKNHVHNILDKLGVQNRDQAARRFRPLPTENPE